MKIRQIQGEYIDTISENNYGKCPKCKKTLQKKVYGSKEIEKNWTRLFCPKCKWIGQQEELTKEESDQIEANFFKE